MRPSVPRPARALASGVALLSALGAAATSMGAAAQDVVPGGAGEGADVGIVDRATRVIGGERTSIARWPSVVALLRPGEMFLPYDRQFCGGTVIASRWVLTAAHCLIDPFGGPMDGSELVVLAGQSNLAEPSEGREILVTNVFRHPGYVDDATGRTRDDIALLELATDAPTPTSELFAGDPEDYPGELGVIVGWGATEDPSFGGTPFPDALQEAAVPLVPFATCDGPQAYAGDVAEGQFCAGFDEGGVDACTGDSGGPLYVRVDDRVQLAGVTSFGRGCALPDFYGIYTDVAAYLDWIRTYVELPVEPVPPVAVARPDPSGGVPPDAVPRVPGGGGGAAGDGPSDGGGSGGGGGALGLAGLLALLGGVRRRRRVAAGGVRVP